MKACSSVLVGLLALFPTAVLRAQLPPADSPVPPGTLARDRLGPKVLEILAGATRVEAAVQRWGRPEDYTDIVTVGAKRDLNTSFARRLMPLLLDDDVYATDMPSSRVSVGSGGDPLFTFWFYRGDEEARLEILPGAASFRLMWQTADGMGVSAFGDLYPIAGRLWAILRTALPDVKLPPEPRFHPPSDTSQSEIPAAALYWIRTVKPGMTRRDLLRVCFGQGGLSCRFQRTFLLRDRVDVLAETTQPGAIPDLMLYMRQFYSGPTFHRRDGRSVKIDIEFAAPEQKVLWRGGRGYIIDRWNTRRLESRDDRDDVIISVSQPYLGYDILN